MSWAHVGGKEGKGGKQHFDPNDGSAQPGFCKERVVLVLGSWNLPFNKGQEALNVHVPKGPGRRKRPGRGWRPGRVPPFHPRAIARDGDDKITSRDCTKRPITQVRSLGEPDHSGDGSRIKAHVPDLGDGPPPSFWRHRLVMDEHPNLWHESHLSIYQPWARVQSAEVFGEWRSVRDLSPRPGSLRRTTHRSPTTPPRRTFLTT